MTRYCTPSQMKELEKRAVETGISYYTLMENAGECAAAFILNKMEHNGIHGTTAILCGKGNNGGDGFVIARHLADMGVPTVCVMMSDDTGTDLAARELSDLMARGTVPVMMLSDGKDNVFDVLCDCAVIVDAVFGTGFHGKLPDDIAEVFSFADKCAAMKIAVDIPSGGNGQTGSVSDGTMHCAYTVTFGMEKIGTVLAPLNEYCGSITVADIGIPQPCVESMPGLISRVDDDFVKHCIKKRPVNSHKGNFGRLINVSGSRNMPGAAALSTKAMLRSGAGLVKLASVEGVVNAVSASVYECTYMCLKSAENGAISAENADMLSEEMNKCTAAAIGCGLSVCDDTKKVVLSAVKNTDIPLIIDADGLNCLADSIDIIRNAKGRVGVTPHPAELARMMDMSAAEVAADRLGTAIRFNALYEASVLIKGTPTFVIGSENSYVSFTGNPGLSRGGSGDVLTGIAAAFMAMGIPVTEALACAAYVHGRAADMTADKLSQTGMLPSDVIAELPFVFKELDR